MRPSWHQKLVNVVQAGVQFFTMITRHLLLLLLMCTLILLASTSNSPSLLPLEQEEKDSNGYGFLSLTPVTSSINLIMIQRDNLIETVLIDDLEANLHHENIQKVTVHTKNSTDSVIRRYCCFFVPDHCWDCFYFLWALLFCCIRCLFLRIYDQVVASVSTNLKLK